MKNYCTLFLIYILLSSFGLVEAQDMGNYNYNRGNSTQATAAEDIKLQPYIMNDSTLVINAKLLFNIRPTEQVAIFSLVQSGKTLDNCHELMNSRLNGFLNGLTQMGISTEAIYIDVISQVPTFEYEIEKKIFSRTTNEVPTGFELKKNVHIRCKNDSQTFDKIMILAAQQEIYDYVKSEYYLSQNQYTAVSDSLRNEGIRIIEKKLNQFKKLGFTTTENLAYKTFSEDFDLVDPHKRYQSYEAFNNTSNLKRNYKNQQDMEKSKTFYYTGVSYTDYDLVISPIVLEPTLQMAYQLQVRYVFKRK